MNNLGRYQNLTTTAYVLSYSIAAAKERTVPKAHIRKGRLTIPLPDDIREKLDVRDGDELEVSSKGGRIVLTPKEDLAERDPEIDAAIAEGLADVRAGRVSPAFQSMSEFEAWLKTDQGKKFGKG
jgi:AbrB family looped-hinge helix DNA binding protein